MRLTILLLLGFIASAHAQISLQRPLERCVYQRNNQNIGWVEVSGTFSGSLSKVEAKLVPFAPNQGTETDWQTITTTGNQIAGRVRGLGGFYNLHLRGTTNNGTQITKEVNRVGIGEIFMVAGQSNTAIEGPFATDERVLGVNYALDVPGYPTFIDLKEGMYKWIYPSGSPISFCGSLGDILVKKYNVPVLFMGAGASGSTAGIWYYSIENKQQPYEILKSGLNRFGKEYGFRAVLWHQGETNSVYNLTPAAVYQSELTGVIKQSRTDFNYQQLAWVVARVSWAKKDILNANDPNDPNEQRFRTETISGQNAVITSVPNVFAGPETDKIEGYKDSEMRADGVHFTFAGQSKHAELWNEKLDPLFWKNTTPYLPYSQILKDQTINFPALSSKIFNKDVITLSATATSNLPITYKVISGNAKLNLSLLTIDKPSKITVEASQSGGDIYNPGTSVQRSFEIFKIPQKIVFPVIPEKAHNTSSFDLLANTNSNLPISFKIITGPATIEGKTIKLTGQSGTVIVEASQLGDDFYESAVERQEFKIYLLLGTENISSIVVYPNPAKNYFNIDIELGKEIIMAELINTNGISQKIDLQKINSMKYSLDISRIQAGFYILKLQDKKNNYYHKNIIIE